MSNRMGAVHHPRSRPTQSSSAPESGHASWEFENGARMVTVAKWRDGAIAEEYIWS